MAIIPLDRVSFNSSSRTHSLPENVWPLYCPFKQEQSQCFSTQLANCFVRDYGPELASLLLAVAKQRIITKEASHTIYKTYYTIFPQMKKNPPDLHWCVGLKCVFIPVIQRLQQGTVKVQWILNSARGEESWVCYWWCG